MPSSSSSSSPLSPLERALPPILESYLRGSSFQAALKPWVANNAPKFKNFNKKKSTTNKGKERDERKEERDEEYTLDQTRAHLDFMEVLETLLQGRLNEFGVDASRFAEVLGAMLDDSTAAEVLAAVEARDTDAPDVLCLPGL
jgi:hypothetical protein